jgi:hypothetical protein
MKDAGCPVSSRLIGFLRGRLFGFVFVSACRFVRATVGRRQFLFDLFGDAALPRVISDVPAFTFELNRRRGKLFLKRAATLSATLRLLVRRAHEHFEMRAAFLASIFVNWHDCIGFESDYTSASEEGKPTRIALINFFATCHAVRYDLGTHQAVAGNAI